MKSNLKRNWTTREKSREKLQFFCCDKTNAAGVGVLDVAGLSNMGPALLPPVAA